MTLITKINKMCVTVIVFLIGWYVMNKIARKIDKNVVLLDAFLAGMLTLVLVSMLLNPEIGAIPED